MKNEEDRQEAQMQNEIDNKKEQCHPYNWKFRTCRCDVCSERQLVEQEQQVVKPF